MSSVALTFPKLKSQLIARFAHRHALWILTLPIVARTVFYLAHLPSFTPDSIRFLKQAESLLSGMGYPAFNTLGAQLATAPPPGYPLYIALVYFVNHSEPFLRFTQLGLSIASCFLIYHSLKNRSRGFAITALFIAALCPWTGRIMVYVLSETFSIFLSSVIVYCLSRFERGTATNRIALLTGLSTSLLMLTAPATVPLGYCLMAYLFYRQWRRTSYVGVLFVAWLVPMIPWQMDCYQRTGKIQPGIIYLLPDSGFTQGFTQWYKTWAMGDELYYFWTGPSGLLEFPPSAAFDSDSEKKMVLDWAADRVAEKMTSDQYQTKLSELATQRMREHPIRSYVVLPTLRAITLWVPMMTFAGVRDLSAAFLGLAGVPPDTKTDARAFLALLAGAAVLFSYLALDAFFAYLAFKALQTRQVLPWLIVLCIALYVTVSAISGLGEDRRNFPFYPFLLFLAWWTSEAPRPTGAAR